MEAMVIHIVRDSTEEHMRAKKQKKSTKGLKAGKKLEAKKPLTIHDQFSITMRQDCSSA